MQVDKTGIYSKQVSHKGEKKKMKQAKIENKTATPNTEKTTMQNNEPQAAACPPSPADTLFTGELLTLAEVAKILKVSRKTLYAWKAQGKIRFVKVAGVLIRIPRADLAALITRNDDGDPAAALA